MAQDAWVNLNPAVDDGITLATKLNLAMAALYSSHSGVAAPPAPVKGQTWLDTSAEALTPPLLTLKAYDGGTWRTLWTLNKTTGAFQMPGPKLTSDLTLEEFSPSIILNSAPSAGNRGVLSQTNGVDRMMVFLGAGAESTGSAGSNLTASRHDDAGVSLGTWWAVTRATGEWGIGGAVLAGHALTVRTPATAISEKGLALLNVNTGNDADVDLRFLTGAAAVRGRIRGQREAASNNGKLVLGTFVGTTESDVLTLGSDKRAMFAGDTVGIATARTPASAAAAGVQGQVCWDSGFVYVCVATNSWKRAALAAW